MTEQSTFLHDLSALINRHSMENGSNTPDFILSTYLVDSLYNLDRVISDTKLVSSDDVVVTDGELSTAIDAYTNGALRALSSLLEARKKWYYGVASVTPVEPTP